MKWILDANIYIFNTGGPGILSCPREDRVVLIRFGHDWDPTFMNMEETMYRGAKKGRGLLVSPKDCSTKYRN